MWFVFLVQCEELRINHLTLTGRSLRSQVEHHVRDKFATPTLYGMNNFIFYDIFSTYT